MKRIAAVLAMMSTAFTSGGEAQPVVAAPALDIAREGDSVWIRQDGQNLLRYRFQDVPFKPYVQAWYSPSGVNILRDSPSDHKHHHALMFATKVDNVNFWEEQEAPGLQVHQDFDALETGPIGDTTYARIVQRLNWVHPKSGEVLLQETRTIAVYDTGTPSLLTWESRFTVPPGKGKSTLGGAHYHGLGMRFVESMDTVGSFTVPGGKLGELVRGDEHLSTGPWCAYTAPAGGHDVTVALFDDPGNLRPALWFTMKEHFAYLSATVNLWREPLTITEGTPLVLRYGAALWDTPVEKEQIEAVRRQWLDLAGPLKP
jgi:hypothetical protein